MLGLFGLLNLGSSSLDAQSLATEVAGQNLANVNNPAYSRQQVVLQTSTDIPTPAGMEGTGVTAVTIQQFRNALLDQQIQSEGSSAGSLNAQQSALQNAETALGEELSSTAAGTSGSSTTNTTGSPNGLAQQLSNFFNAFQSLTTNPTSLAQRQVLVQTAQSLASQFNQVSAGLGTLRTGLNTSIQNDVASANQLLGNIATLNQQIVYAQAASGGTANDLIDQREQDLEQLAGYVNTSTSTETNGSVDVSVGGAAMVTGISQTDSLTTFDAGGGQMQVSAASSATPTALNITGGSIAGEMDTRDGALATLQSSVNTLAGQLITQVNNISNTGFDLNGNQVSTNSFFTGTDAASIQVSNALVTDPTKVQASGVAGSPGDNSVALAIAQLGNQSIAALNNSTFNDSYATTVASLGQSIDSVNEQVGNQSAVSTMLNNQRTSYGGVNLDEEMTNLMQFQKAYEASAKLITTVAAMLETAVTMKST